MTATESVWIVNCGHDTAGAIGVGCTILTGSTIAAGVVGGVTIWVFPGVIAVIIIATFDAGSLLAILVENIIVRAVGGGVAGGTVTEALIAGVIVSPAMVDVGTVGGAGALHGAEIFSRIVCGAAAIVAKVIP